MQSVSVQSRVICFIVVSALLPITGCADKRHVPVPNATLIPSDAITKMQFVKAEKDEELRKTKLLEEEKAPGYTFEQLSENKVFRLEEGRPQYKVGEGDILEVTVTQDASQDKQTAAVTPQGTLSVFWTEVPVDGLTITEIVRRIEKAIQPYFRSPTVEVSVKGFNSKKVTLLSSVSQGAGRGTGIYPLSGRTTLTELLVRSGGVGPRASLEDIQVNRGDGKIVRVNLLKLISEGDLARDYVLDGDDTVVLFDVDPGQEKRIFVLGEVRTPGVQSYIANMKLINVITAAGGITDSGMAHEARIIRGDLRKPQILAPNVERLLKNGDLSQNIPMEAFDIVYVPRRRIADWNAFVGTYLYPTFGLITAPFSTSGAVRGGVR